MTSIQEQYDSFPKTSQRWGSVAKQDLESIVNANHSLSNKEIAIKLHAQCDRHCFSEEMVQAQMKLMHLDRKQRKPPAATDEDPVAAPALPAAAATKHQYLIPVARSTPKNWQELRQESRSRALLKISMASSASEVTKKKNGDLPYVPLSDSLSDLVQLPADKTMASRSGVNLDFDDHQLFDEEYKPPPTRGHRASPSSSEEPPTKKPPSPIKPIHQPTTPAQSHINLMNPVESHGMVPPFTCWAFSLKKAFIRFSVDSETRVGLSWPPKETRTLNFTFTRSIALPYDTDSQDLKQALAKQWPTVCIWSIVISLPVPVDVLELPKKTVDSKDVWYELLLQAPLQLCTHFEESNQSGSI